MCITRDNRVLLGKRRNSLGDGHWAFPGGHLEFGESLQECAEREVKEETGLVIGNIRQGPISEDLFPNENKHYITIIMMADYIDGEPQLLEPDKCTQWQWFAWDALPSPLFLTLINLAKNNIDLLKT